MPKGIHTPWKSGQTTFKHFYARFDFTEPVTGFEQTDVSFTTNTAEATITLWHPNDNKRTYVAHIRPTRSGEVNISIDAGVATDTDSNANTAATPQTVTVEFSLEPPTISMPSGVQNGPFDITITFAEPVYGFGQYEFNFSGSRVASKYYPSITALNTTDNITYTGTLTPKANYSLSVRVIKGAAVNAAGNPTSRSLYHALPKVDIVPPSVEITVPSEVQSGSFNVTISFTEKGPANSDDRVFNFVQSDLTLSGNTANASITSWNTTDNKTYVAEITPTASGQVTFNVAADVATDEVGNANVASTPKAVIIVIPGQEPETDPEPIPDPATWMPDGALRVLVREALGLSNSEILTQASMVNLTEFDGTEYVLGRGRVSKLTGLEYAVNLQTLNLSGLYLGDDDGISSLSTLTVLTELDLSRNYDISDISPLENMTGLTWLDLSVNEIEDLSPLENLTGLTELDFSGNGIEDLSSLENLTGLTELDLSDNDIEDLSPLENMTGLTWLDVSGNEIEDLSSLENLTGLTELDLSDNDIRDVNPLKSLTALTRLDLFDNEISDVSSLENLTGLSELHLSGNHISDLSSLENLTGLTELDLSDNDIRDVNPLKSLTALTRLNLSNSVIEDLSPLNNLTALTWLSLDSISDLTPITDLTETDRAGYFRQFSRH